MLISIIKQLSKCLPRKALIQIYKSFIRPCLDYCDIIYHKPTHGDFSNKYYSGRAPSDPMYINFTNKIKAVQYNTPLAITRCIRGTERLYSELGLTSL